MRVAAIDIGTNTVLLLVAEKDPSGRLVAVEEHSTITRLGEGVDKTRRLLPAAIERTNAAIDRYAEIVSRLGVAKISVVGTSAMRDAEGGENVRRHVLSKLGAEARTISGDEEAKLTFAGALSGIDALSATQPVCVFDIGGGSTEVVQGDAERRHVSFARSYDVGSVRLTERYVQHDPPTNAELDAIRADARGVFATVPTIDASSPPIGIAGTMTTLAAVSMKMAVYDGARVHGATLTTSEVERVVFDLARRTLEQRSLVPGLEPKRADVIVAGGLVALAFLEHVGAREVRISDRGVRWGIAEELAREEPAT